MHNEKRLDKNSNKALIWNSFSNWNSFFLYVYISGVGDVVQGKNASGIGAGLEADNVKVIYTGPSIASSSWRGCTHVWLRMRLEM